MRSLVCDAFGKNLRSVRQFKGFSQEGLARLAEIDRSYLGKVERGEVNITIERIYLLAECLQCSPKDLVPDVQQISG
ncbi:transcriptional regulator [Marinobacter sp. Z-F4-2]|nr:transcriptional regulator [Marinobacter sp. Z-F4-2]